MLKADCKSFWYMIRIANPNQWSLIYQISYFQLVRFCKPHLSIMSICNAHINCHYLDLLIDIELLKADCKSEPAGIPNNPHVFNLTT
jgi:hypothetical protein